MSKEQSATPYASDAILAARLQDLLDFAKRGELGPFGENSIQELVDRFARSETPCKAASYAPNGGASQEQRWSCEECGDVTDTISCPKGRQNATLAKLASAPVSAAGLVNPMTGRGVATGAAACVPSARRCKWTQDADGIYHTGCGEAFTFDSGTAKENKAKFCQYCGSDLIAKEHDDDAE